MTEPEATAASPEVVLELYKLTVEMADRISSRRANANSFFLTLQTALAAALGAFATGTSITSRSTGSRFVLIVAIASGLVLVAAWWLLLRSYRDLSRAKFAVITSLEQHHLPIQPFSDEWSELKKDPVKRFRPRYAELGSVERIVPIAFGVIYIVIAIYVACL